MDDRYRSCPPSACGRCEYGKSRAQFSNRTPLACKKRFLIRIVPFLDLAPLPATRPAYAETGRMPTGVPANPAKTPLVN